MKSNKLSITINKPLSDVFAFTLNPDNTPKWIDAIVFEETNESPAKLGTIYRNKNANNEWSEYKITKFKENEVFVMTKKEKGYPYHVRYGFKLIDNNATELEYYEWVDTGELKGLFSQEILMKLKQVMEQSDIT